MSTIRDLALNQRCPACHVEPGEWCETFKPRSREPGVRATDLHVERWEAIAVAFQAGRQHGLDEILFLLATDGEAATRQALARANEEGWIH